MFLKQISCKNKMDIEIKVSMEKIVDDLLMINVKIDSKNDKAYYDYWRLTKTIGIPPLEIGIDKTDGTIQTIVFYVDLNDLKNFDLSTPQNKHEGLVTMDTSIFQKENDYVDINESYFVSFKDNKLYCCFTEAVIPDESYNINQISISLNKGKVIGFSIADLTEYEKQLLSPL